MRGAGRAVLGLAGLMLASAAAVGGTTVGRIDGDFATTATGGAAYSIPIQVAAGMNGLRPELALQYNSQSGDGLAGVGWTITGFSEIARCGQIRALDGRTTGVRFSSADRFCLDGQPLVLVTGVHGRDGAEYRLEVGNYERIFARGAQGSGPAWFEMQLPDGTVQRFGNDEDSRAEAAGSTEVRAWALNEIEDRYRQRIGFGYSEDAVNGEHLPVEVSWTYGPGETFANGRYRLVLEHEARPAGDLRQGWLWGTRWQVSRRLREIRYEYTSDTGRQLVHRYTLEYHPTSDAFPRSRLAQLTQCGVGDCLPPTRFEWEAEGELRVDALPYLIGQSPRFADVNGDGAADAIAWDGSRYLLYTANPQQGGFSAALPISPSLNGTRTLKAIEFDGDGRADLLVSMDGRPNWLVYRAPAAAGQPFTVQDTGILRGGLVEPLDVDGDGLDDLATVSRGEVRWRRNTGAGFSTSMPSGIPTIYVDGFGDNYPDGAVTAGDFDGDGRSDLMVYRPPSLQPTEMAWRIHLSNGAGFEATSFDSVALNPIGPGPVLLDANGDGLTDILTLGRRGPLKLLLSAGTTASGLPALREQVCPETLQATATRNFHYFAVDTDADGRSEVVTENSLDSSAAAYSWRIHRAVAGCYSPTSALETPQFEGRNLDGSITHVGYAGDVGGDGRSDLVFPDWLGNRTLLLRRDPAGASGDAARSRGDQVIRITDGLGNQHAIRYRALSGWSGYTASGVNTTGTRLLLGGALSVVESYESPSGQGNGRYTVSLGYRNARISTSGRAQLTFDSIRATDSRTGLVTETLYRSDFPYAGRINRSTTWNGTQRVAESTPAWGSLRTVISAATLVQPAVAHYFVYLQGEVASGFEVDTDGGLAGSLVRTTTRQLTWNLQHGAVTTERVTVTSPLQAGASYRTTRQVTLDEGQRSAGCLGQPGRVDVTADVNGVAAPARTTQFTYDATTCRVLTQLVGPAAEPGKQVRTSLLYDVSGRVTHVTRVDGTGQLAPRETRFRYETSPFRASSEAQIIAGEPDYVTTRSWNDALGIATALTDAQGLTTTWYHDEFARLGGEFRPRGNTLTSYGSCGPCSAPGAVYAVRQLRSDGYWTETQHDSFGRVVGSLAVLADGRASRQLTEYDAFGRVARRSVPHLDGAPALYWTSYGYDLLGRPKRVTQSASEASPEGSISLLVYAGLETTRRDAELRTVTFQHDAAGRMTTVRTPLGGGATYSYDANGQLTSLADAAGHTRRLQYDARGLLVESNDPDAGRRLLGYNAYGELVQQQDAQAPVNTMTAEYDQLGRMVRRSEPEGVTTWRYSTTPGPSRGQLQQVTGPTAASATGFSESYSYGPVGWLRQTTTVIDGASYVTDRTYDAEGKVVTMTYPATVGWRPLFRLSYNLGHLVGITQENAGSTPVWTLLTMDAQGRETAARFGSGAVEERLTHDAASGRLTAIQSGLTPGARDVQHLAYQWDKVGNLVARENLGLAPQRRETFSYDELNRLTRVALNGTDTLTLSYAANGNILTKSDVGSYSYGAGAALPHAVTAIAGGPRPASSYTYDANGNLTAGAGRSLSWTSFNMPKQITLGTDYSRFSYGPGRARVRQDLKSGSTVKTVHYVGPHSEVEIEGATRRYRSNVFAYGRMVYSQLESTPSGLEGYYVLHDHAGSVDQLVRAVGAGVDRQSFAFDAWGKRRNANWSADTTDQRYQDAQFAERGYTGHEHLDHLRLVHMNGRLDDPLLGRMISPDPVLGDLADPGSLNPYSYVANNPLSFTDPSGYFLKRIGKFFKRAISGIGSFFRRVFDKWGTEIAAVVGSYYAGKAVDGWASRAGLSDVSWSYGTPGHASNGALVPGSTLTADVPAGAFLGAVIGGMVAGGISSGTLKGAALGAVGGGVSGGVASYYGGSYTAGRVITEAYIGGGTAAAHGGSFGVGASVSGGLSSLTWAALAMRRAMIAQSMLWNPESKLVNRETGEELQGPPTPSPNARGLSAGFRFDFFKLGGSRFPSTNSVLGGFQGGRGNVFGIGYGPGSFLDGLVETYAGPHDFLNSPLFYDSFGNNQKRFWAWEVVNAANVLVATPFAAASVVPPSAYGTLAGP